MNRSLCQILRILTRSQFLHHHHHTLQCRLNVLCLQLTPVLADRSVCFSSSSTVAPSEKEEETVGDSVKKERLRKLIETLNDFNPRDVMSSATALPELLETSPYKWRDFLSLVKSYGFSDTAGLDLIVAKPDLLHRKPKEISEAINNWLDTQLGEYNVLHILSMQPDLFFINPQVLKYNISVLVNLGHVSKISKALVQCPNMLLDPIGNLEDKIEYIIDVMKAKENQILKSGVLNYSLADIKTRHVFLERIGVYKTSRKRDDDEPNNNPTLTEIYSSSEQNLALAVAGVSAEEFYVFKELFILEMEDEEVVDSSEDESNSINPKKRNN